MVGDKVRKKDGAHEEHRLVVASQKTASLTLVGGKDINVEDFLALHGQCGGKWRLNSHKYNSARYNLWREQSIGLPFRYHQTIQGRVSHNALVAK